MKRLPLIILILCCVAAITVGAGNDSDTRDARARSALARYMYYRANEVIAPVYSGIDSGLSDGIYLLEAARNIDDPNLDAAASLGRFTLLLNLGDSLAQRQAYHDVIDHYFIYPENIADGQFASDIAGKLNDIDAFIRITKSLADAYPDRTDLQMDLADGYSAAFMGGDSAYRDSAMMTLQSLEDRLGPEPALIMRYAWLDNGNLDTAAIVDKIRQFTLSRPTDASALYYTARMYGMFQYTDSATKYLVMACEADSTYGPAYLALADEYLRQGDSIAYDHTVIGVISSPELELDDKLRVVQSYFQNAYTDSTRIEFTDSIFTLLEDQHAGEPQIYLLRGAYFATKKEYARSAENFRYALDLDRDNVDTYRMLIEVQQKAGDTIGAIATGHIAIDKCKDNLFFPLLTAGMEMTIDRPEAALATLDSFDISDFNNPSALSSYYQTRADALYKLGQTDSAFAEYDRAIALDPDNSMAKNNAAYFMACSGIDLDRARKLAEEAVAADPLNPTQLDTYAWVLFKLKEYKEAREQIDLALSSCGVKVADGSVVVGAPAEGNDDIEEASAEIYDHAGDIYFMNGEPDLAVQFWQLAIKLEPTNKQILKKIQNRAYFFE